jgi:integrase
VTKALHDVFERLVDVFERLVDEFSALRRAVERLADRVDVPSTRRTSSRARRPVVRVPSAATIVPTEIDRSSACGGGAEAGRIPSKGLAGMRTRPYGAGAIEERNGRFRARQRIGGERIELGSFPTRAEAEGVIAAAAERVAAGEFTAPGAVTLRAFGEGFLDRREGGGEHADVATDRSRWRSHVASARFADEPLASLTPAAIRDWLAGLGRKEGLTPIRTKKGTVYRGTGRKLSRGTVRHAQNLLSVCLDDAVEAGLLGANPARMVRRRRSGTTAANGGWTYLHLEEIRQLLTCKAIPERTRVIITVAVYQGLREGELWGLRWEDVRLDGPCPELEISHSYGGPTKSRATRHVPMLEPARQALLRWREVGGRSSGLVFPSRGGEMYAKDYDAGWADKKEKGQVTPGIKSRAGITRKVRFHDLRHYPACRIIPRRWWQRVPRHGALVPASTDAG